MKKPTVTIRPIETSVSDATLLEKRGDSAKSTPSSADSIEAPPLKYDDIASQAKQEEVSKAWKATASQVTEQTIAIRNDRLRKVCERLERELRKRSFEVVERNADAQIEVRLTELGFDSLHGFDFRADATVNNWSTFAQGKSLDKISVSLAKQIAEYFRSGQFGSPR